MLVNADFTRRVVIRPEERHWVPSPQRGVTRVMLDRVGGEKARATSLVRYSDDAVFPPHKHPAGEEIFVINGTFSDSSGDYSEGWYLRNPPGSEHSPSSRSGGLIFVKLMQMHAHETMYTRVDTRDASRWVKQSDRDVCLLFQDDDEYVRLERLSPNARVLDSGSVGCSELLVVEGTLIDGAEQCSGGTWIRQPAAWPSAMRAGVTGAVVYIKSAT